MAATFHASGKNDQTASAASFTITCTISAGDFLVVVASWDSASTTTPTVATTGGTGSDTGTLILGPITAGSFGLKYAAWLVSSAGAGRTGVTVSWASSSPSFADGYCWSASGLTTPTLDKSPNTSGNSTNPSSGTTGTLSTADQFCVSYAAEASTIVTTSTGGFTFDGNTPSTGSGGGHQVVAATTALTGSFTAATSAWAALALTIKSGGAATSPFAKTDWGKPYDLVGLPPQQFVRDPSKFPNPIPFVSTDRRDTRRIPFSAPPQLLPLNINLFTNPIPFKLTDWSQAKDMLPPPSRAPDQPYNRALYNGVVVTAPFYQTNWPIPTLREPSVGIAQPNTLINLLAQPLIGPDLSISKFLVPRAPDATSYNASLYTVTVAASPFFQSDWSTTRFPKSSASDASQSTSINLFPDPTQFMLVDWSGSGSSIRARAADQQTYNLALYTVTVAAAPFVPVDWSRPFFQRQPPPDQRSLNINLFTPPAGPMPFSQYSWTPASKPTVRFDKMAQNFAILVPFTPPPPSTLVHNLPFFVTVGKLKSF